MCSLPRDSVSSLQRVRKIAQVGSSWHKWVKWNRYYSEAGLQVYVGQVGQEQGGLQIDVEQVDQEQGVCPAEPLHLTQSGIARPCNILASFTPVAD